MNDVAVPFNTLEDVELVLISCQGYLEAHDIADAQRNFVEGDVPYSPLTEKVVAVRQRLMDIKKDHIYREYEEGDEEAIDDEEEYIEDEELDNFDDVGYNGNEDDD